MNPNNFIVTVCQGPTFITESVASAYQVALDLIEMGYAPHIAVYSVIGGR